VAENWLQHSFGTFSLDLVWTINPNEVLVLYGPSGSGKSLTLRSIAGLIRPNHGRIEVEGRVVFDSNGVTWVPPHERGIGYVPQNYALFPHLTIAQNVSYGMEYSDSLDRDQQLEKLLVGLRITELANRYPDAISGGQQQRVALARALATRPKMLLLDEPLAALDLNLRIVLREELRQILESLGIPTIMVTHDRDDVLTLGHRVLFIDNGRIIADGDPITVLHQSGVNNVTRRVGAENLFHARVVERFLTDGTMACMVDSCRFTLPLLDLPDNSMIRVGLSASDVLLAIAEPRGISAQNVLKGVVSGITQQGQEVYVEVNCGAQVTALVTPRAGASLGLKQGLEVWVVIKAMSFFLIGHK
jgi:molybdate transport system ATP-binding protein